MRSRRPARPDPTTPGSNLAGRDTALLEALWRGDELAAALRAAQATLAARDRDFARAEETIAELSEIVDAAQAALVQLRVKAADADEAAKRDRELRDAVAAELFRLAHRSDALPEENVPTIPRRPRFLKWWSSIRHLLYGRR
jgi:hypothetical protein